ncbi:c-type cytochrome [Robiginitalea marina]|uniref:Cytochrome c n=1 Tax=Robiginitalea marina TaxID=2954105 RepID=A0ABT1B0F0_9FLAO|nr:cytochrome c [Robiginitalea marina]MCO5725649.1 cytochrome c [Robiginitalea marina]
MKNTLISAGVIILVLVLASCQDNNQPNYQYMPNMYESVGYETYEKVDWLPEGTEAMIPVENTISRGLVPYAFENTPEGKDASRLAASPLDSLQREENLAVGKQLYDIYCAICHGAKGDGKGTLVQREKILGVPSYADAARNITVGGTYHVIYYGLNSMGSYANQLNHKERWQVSEYVMKLKEDLTK